MEESCVSIFSDDNLEIFQSLPGLIPSSCPSIFLVVEVMAIVVVVVGVVVVVVVNGGGAVVNFTRRLRKSVISSLSIFSRNFCSDLPLFLQRKYLLPEV